jgi:methoxymalonate biosynthesis acyl carrier protein
MTIKSMQTDNTNNVKATIRTFINSSVNIDNLSDEAGLFDSGLINSLFAVQLMTFIERTYNIEIGMDDLDTENFKSINSTAAFVARKTAPAAA